MEADNSISTGFTSSLNNENGAMNKCDRWLSGLYTKLPFEEYVLLDRAARTLEINSNGLRESNKKLPWYPKRGIQPSIAHFHGVWNWDCAFHAIGCSRWDMELAKDQIDIFIDLQLENGLIPDVLFKTGRLADRFGKPPVLAWAAERIIRQEEDLAFTKRAYEAFKKNIDFWNKERGGDNYGLLYYDSAVEDKKERFTKATFESGWDNAVRWDKGISNLWTIDLNCFMVMTYKAVAYMAEVLGKSEESNQYKEEAQALSKRINEKLWDPEQQSYVDYNFVDGEYSRVLSPASFMPLYIGIANEKQAVCMKNIAQEHFCPGWPTVSYHDPAYEPDKYWRGRTWYNVAYFALKGLKDYGFDELAGKGRDTLLGWVQRDPGSIYENYNSQTGNPVGAPMFGWTAAFVIEFLLNF